MNNQPITRRLVSTKEFLDTTQSTFGFTGIFAQIESSNFAFASKLSLDYQGGAWDLYLLSDQIGIFMALDETKSYSVRSPNGCFEVINGLEFGVTSGLFAYSYLSFHDGDLGIAAASQFHSLRDHMLTSDDLDKAKILRLID